MKDIDNIEDWYKEEFEKYSVEPDKGLWQSLSENLDADTPLTDDEISELYQDEVAKLDESPDSEVWEKLAIKLDTSSVWDKLVISLSRYDQFIWWRNLAFKGSAILLFLFGSYLAYDNYTTDGDSFLSNTRHEGSSNRLVSDNTTNLDSKEREREREELKSGSNHKGSFGKNKTIFGKKSSKSEQLFGKIVDDASEKANSDEKTALQKKKDKLTNTIREAKLAQLKKLNKNNNKVLSQDGNGETQRGELRASVSDVVGYDPISVSDLSCLKYEKEKTIFADIDRHNLTEHDISHMYSMDDFLVKKDKNKIVFNNRRFSSYFLYGVYARRLYLGVNFGIKKQGMITSFNNNSELSRYGQTDLLDFGSNLGATIGYIVSDNFNLEANVNFQSTSGYKREFRGEDVAFKQNLNLNYSSIGILAKRMNTKSTFDNKVYSTNFIAGLYAGYLRSAVSNVNGGSQKIDEYNKPDFGLTLGIEQDRYITKMLVITPGVRYNQGILNVASSDSPFNASRNFSFEFNLGVKYIFLKKGN